MDNPEFNPGKYRNTGLNVQAACILSGHMSGCPTPQHVRGHETPRPCSVVDMHDVLLSDLPDRVSLLN